MLKFLADGLITPLLPLFLGAVGCILYIDLRFFPFLRIKTILKTLFRRSDSSSWRALAVALAGTLGVGNIIGVAYAIKLGGAGALFWMWVSALLAMLLKYSETLLAIRHKKRIVTDKKMLATLQRQVGGPMYYIPHRPMATLFAILCIASSFTVGNLLQTNAVSEAFSHSFALSPYLVGISLSVLTFIIIFRGIKRITDFCAVVIPFLSAVYLLMCTVILIRNITELPSLIALVFREAFSFAAIGGGIGASVFFQAIRVGFSKGLITNEAGCGTAPIAHASAETDNAVKQGFLGIVEVFFDTVVLCTASGLVLLLAIQKTPTLSGYELVSSAFQSYFGKIGDSILALSLFFFVLATLVGWSFYGKSALEYFSEKKVFGGIYVLLFSVTAFFGAIGTAEIFWQLSDITLGIMTFINTGYLLYYRKELRKETNLFFHKQQG